MSATSDKTNRVNSTPSFLSRLPEEDDNDDDDAGAQIDAKQLKEQTK